MTIKRLATMSVVILSMITTLLAQQSGPNFTVQQIGNGQYRFIISGLQHLDQLEPAEIYGTPRYELFVETGEGYYVRKTMPNPANATEPFVFVHNFGVREPEPGLMKVTATPLYSPEKKPTIPDAVSMPSPISWLPGNTGGVKLDFVPGGSMVKADLNWSMLEAGDEFVVIAGYQDASSNKIGDLSDGGFISIYYDDKMVEPVLDEGQFRYRSYLTHDPASFSFDPNDKVIDEAGNSINAHIDFEIPPINQGAEEFLFVNFKLLEPEELGDEDRFPISVAVRGVGDNGPTEDAEHVSVYGEVKTGKDPNTLTGMPRPVCLEQDTFDTYQYHVEFFNDGTAAVDSVEIEIALPEHIRLQNVGDIRILEARFGTPNQLNPATMKYGPEILSFNPPRIKLIVAGTGTYLNGYQEPQINSSPQYYDHCSAEFLFEFPRNTDIAACDSLNPIAAELAVTFPSGEIVTRRDTIPCVCTESIVCEDCETFPCNIVPEISFLGGCWCTFLLILLLIVILFLIIVIRRNASKS